MSEQSKIESLSRTGSGIANLKSGDSAECAGAGGQSNQITDNQTKNPNSKIRNSKQIQMIKKKKILNGPFRISIFGFRILLIKDRPHDPAERVSQSGSGDSVG